MGAIKATALIVNDPVEQPQSLDEPLRRARFTLLTARGDEGFVLARQHRADVIVIDLALSRLNGVSLCRRVCREPPRGVRRC
jgi:DNA-binding response OmpR family regulator